MKKHKPLLFASVLSAGLSMAASAAVITVNTANNSDFGVGMTNLWLAIQLANTNGDSANTINFNISGAWAALHRHAPIQCAGRGSRFGGRLPHHHESQPDD
ncbi:MAG: hypothetical protein V9H26_09175 [Verrucomicrobiota bacterium]